MAGDHELYGLLLDAAVRDRDRTALMKYLEMAEETAESCEHPLFQAIAARARGVSQRLDGNIEQAVSYLQEAMDGFRRLDAKWQIGRTLVELGELENLRNNGNSAQDLFAEALVNFEELGAKPDAARVNELVAGH